MCTWVRSDFRLKAQADVNSKTMLACVYMGEEQFLLKAQANIKYRHECAWVMSDFRLKVQADVTILACVYMDEERF